MNNLKDYIIADGPEGLMKILTDLLEKSQSDPMFSREAQYVLYQIGQQKSLIKIDTSQMPFQFWHCDLMGRPATIAVKDTIAKFLWEKCGVKEQHLQEIKDNH